VDIYLEGGADDLHMVMLMALPHHLLLHENPDWFILSSASLTRLSWKGGHKMGVCLCDSSNNNP